MDIIKYDKDPNISGQYKTTYGSNNIQKLNKDIKNNEIEDKKENNSEKVLDYSFIDSNTTISDLLQEQFSWKE